ncbi:hypothetical protein FACS1894216_01290 [Synergistales bacterium]|nr:hypothetical protein FACS1894216_01290 [Synergistales bacterium]
MAKDLSARIHITPKLSVRWPIYWDNHVTAWDYNPWQKWKWPETLWLYWNNLETVWDEQRWYFKQIDSHIKSEWKVINGELYLEVWLNLTDTHTPPRLKPTRWTVKSNLSFELFKPYKIERYLALPTWEHRRPKFLAVLEHMITPLVEMENQAYTLAARGYNVDTAAGEELDRIGEWVGIGREIWPPLGGVYFTWDDRKTNGWDIGLWIKDDDSPAGITRLPDNIYRFLVKGKIAANHWDGTVDSAYAVWDEAFNGEVKIFIRDNQDMSMDMILVVEDDDTLLRAILRDELLPLRPTGVKVNYEIVVGGPIFIWDVAPTPATGGWDNGKFALKTTEAIAEMTIP